MAAPHSFAERFIRLNIFKRFWVSAGSVIGFVGSFIILTAFSIHEFGLYQLVLAAVALTDAVSVNFFDEVVSNDITRALADKQKGVARRLFHELAFFRIGLGILSACALFAGANVIAKMYDADIGFYIQLASLLVVVRAVRSTADLFLRAVASFRSMGALVIEDVAKIGIVGGLFFFSYLSISWVLIATLIGSVAALLYVGTGFVLEYIAFFSKVESARGFLFFGVIRAYGHLVLFRAAIKRVAKSIRPWLIATLLNVEAVALYTLATNLVTMLKDFFPSVGSALLAWEANHMNRLSHIFSRGIKYSFWYGLAFGGVSLLFVPLLVRLFLPKYLSAMPLFFVFLISVPFHGVQTLEMEILTALREQKILTARVVAEIIMGSGLIIILAPFIGIFATGVGPVAAILWRTWFLYRRIVKKYPELRPDMKTLFRFDKEDRRIVMRAAAEVRLFFRPLA